MDKMNAITEQVLYAIKDEVGEIKTRSICQKFEYRDTLVKSQLQQLRDRGMVEVSKHQEYGGNAKPTNHYSTRRRASEYEDEYGLSVPRYVLRQDFDEWSEYFEKHTDALENRVKALEQRVDELEDDS